MTSRDRSRQILKPRCHRPYCPPDWARGPVMFVSGMHGLPYRCMRCAECGQQRLVRETTGEAQDHTQGRKEV